MQQARQKKKGTRLDLEAMTKGPGWVVFVGEESDNLSKRKGRQEAQAQVTEK